MTDRNRAVPAVYLILRRGPTILLSRRSRTGYFDGRFELPAGHVEAGELPRQAAVREAREELGVTTEWSLLSLAHIMYRTKHDQTGDRVDFFFTVRTWAGTPAIQEPEKCDDVRWFSSDELPLMMVPHVRVALDNIRRGILSSELGINHPALKPEFPDQAFPEL